MIQTKCSFYQKVLFKQRRGIRGKVLILNDAKIFFQKSQSLSLSLIRIAKGSFISQVSEIRGCKYPDETEVFFRILVTEHSVMLLVL